MDKKEILEFLAENLRVEVTTDMDGDINVALMLNGEQISKDWTAIPKDE